MMRYGRTQVVICEDAASLGRRAATTVSHTMRDLLAKQELVRIVFAAAESQNTFFDALAQEADVDWSRVICFNMDELWEPRMAFSYTCGAHTKARLYDKVRPRQFHLVQHDAPDAQAEAERFEKLLRDHAPIDITTQGIGRSGHLALNEPGTTDFNDPRWVRVVDVADDSKKQLMEDPHFQKLGYVPDKGITMTMPALHASRFVYTIVPLASKRPILTRLFAMTTPDERLPASYLLNVNSTLFVDRDSCPTEYGGR